MTDLNRIAEEVLARLAKTKIRRHLSPELLRRARDGRCFYCAQPVPEDRLGALDGYCSHACRRYATC